MPTLIGTAAPRLPLSVEPMLVEHRPGWIYQIPMSTQGPNFNVSNADDAALANFALQYLLNNYGGGKLQWGPFNYIGQSTMNIPARMFVVEGAGFLTQWQHNNAGPCFNSHGSEPGGSAIQGTGTIFESFSIDGTNVPSNAISTGMSIGDNNDFYLNNVTIQNFTATGTSPQPGNVNSGANPTGAVGLAIDNQVSLTEKLFARVNISNCGTPNLGAGATNPGQGGGAGVLLVTTTGVNTSHMYTHDLNIHFTQQAGQNGLVIARQGHLMNGHMKMFGNFYCPNSGQAQCAGIVMGVQNTTGGNPQAGHIQRMHLEIYCELDNTNGLSGAPFTIWQGGNADNTINKCSGRMSWLGGTNGWQNTNLPIATNGTFEFTGPVIGSDTVLGQTGLVNLGIISSGTPVNYNGPDCVMFITTTGGAPTNVVMNGTNLPNSSIPGLFPMTAGMSFTITFPGTCSVSQYRYTQGG